MGGLGGLGMSGSLGQNTPEATTPSAAQRVTAVTYFLPCPALTSAPANEALQKPQKDNQILQSGP